MADRPLQGGDASVAGVSCQLLGQGGHGGSLSHGLASKASTALVGEG